MTLTAPIILFCAITYEWSSYLVIQKNGRRIEVPEAPIFSPDSNAFVVASASLDYEMIPNSL